MSFSDFDAPPECVTEVAMLKAQFNDCLYHARQKISIDYEKHTIKLLDAYNESVLYVPTKTGKEFHESNGRIRIMRGHVGSGKTTAMCAELIFRAAAMPPCSDGIRRSRFAIIRNTYGDLVKTTIHTWNQWWKYLGKQIVKRNPSYSINHTFDDGKGLIELELLPIALNTVYDVTKHLKSLEVTGVFLNEVSELNKLVLDFFSGGRLPRFPRKIDFPEDKREGRIYWSGIFGDTNPPEQDSWIYKLFEEQRPKGYEMFAQPPAVIKVGDEWVINPAAENITNISNGEEEYINMTYGKSEAYIKVYLQGEYGTLSEEKRVYYNYNDDIHSSDHLSIIVDEPLIIGADLGTVAPTIVIAQLLGARLVALQEFCGEFTTMAELCEDAVWPFLKKNCDGMHVDAVVYDPSDTYDGAEQLRRYFGDVVVPAITNNVEQRIDAVSMRLNTLIKGKPALCISRGNCPQLRKGFNGKYYYKRLRLIGEERYTEEPNKIHPYSDVHDALHYICLYCKPSLKEDDKEQENTPHYSNRSQANIITGY